MQDSLLPVIFLFYGISTVALIVISVERLWRSTFDI